MRNLPDSSRAAIAHRQCTRWSLYSVIIGRITARQQNSCLRQRFPPPVPVLYLAIPAHNEVATIGVLLWRLRTVLAEFPREYEVVVYDDASTDETADVAEQYMHAMPVTVLRGTTPIGYAGAVNTLIRHIAGHTRYPRRDAMLLLQGDFTDPPGIVPEFARRFEGGADVVVGERTAVADAPTPVRRLFTAAGWALKPFVRVEGVNDLTGSMRLMRISALRDLLRTVGEDTVCEGDSWTANADLLLRLVPHARRVETVPVEPTYGVRTRDTRRLTVRDTLAALRWAWRARGRRAVPTSAPETAVEGNARNARPATGRRRDEPEVTADRLRDRSRERDRLRGGSDAAPTSREGRSGRDREGAHSTRKERPPRPERQPRRGRAAAIEADATLMLDDPFAGRATGKSVDAVPVASSSDARARDEPERARDEPERVVELGVLAGNAEAIDDGASVLESDVDDASQGADGRERKRRRNRRSRRRKSRTRGDASSESESEDVSRPTVAGATTRMSAHGADETPVADGDVNDRESNEGKDDAVSGEADATESGRAKRRGRRGRRGGSRRARGPGRDGADASGRDATGAGDSLPPSSPPSDSE